jgi:hypothetical protein
VKPFSVIAEELGRSVEAVCSKIIRLGLKVNYDDEEQKNFSLSSSFADFSEVSFWSQLITVGQFSSRIGSYVNPFLGASEV